MELPITEKILASADVSSPEGLDQLQKDLNLAAAGQVALKILSMDYISAQLRLIHSGHLRDGDFDADRLELIISHLYTIKNAAESILPLAHTLTPTTHRTT